MRGFPISSLRHTTRPPSASRVISRSVAPCSVARARKSSGVALANRRSSSKAWWPSPMMTWSAASVRVTWPWSNWPRRIKSRTSWPQWRWKTGASAGRSPRGIGVRMVAVTGGGEGGRIERPGSGVRRPGSMVKDRKVGSRPCGMGQPKRIPIPQDPGPRTPDPGPQGVLPIGGPGLFPILRPHV